MPPDMNLPTLRMFPRTTLAAAAWLIAASSVGTSLAQSSAAPPVAAAAPLPQEKTNSAQVIVVEVDVTDAPRRLFRSRLRIPVQPGPLTLRYPKWIPGEHGPSGPISDLAGLVITAGGRELRWRRDPLEYHAFRLEVPPGVFELEVALESILPASVGHFGTDACTSAHAAILNWNRVLLYPQGQSSPFAARLRVPDGWRFASALRLQSRTGPELTFEPVSLETLIDSPVIVGRHLETYDLTPGSPVAHRLNIVSDSAAATRVSAGDQAALRRLIAEANALFGGRHYDKYDFLLTLSDQVPVMGLEHHESSDNRLPERTLGDRALFAYYADLLPHELVHSWNGKFRRPAGLATQDPHQPMKTDLLWVYEGLTTYLGQVLAVRSGLREVTNQLDFLALIASLLDHQRGRDWRPLVDTAEAAHLLYGARADGCSRRRSVDFYPEGELIWLEADVIIRRETRGERSLDDFCRTFFGGADSGPAVSPYTLEEVLQSLASVAPYDWRGFFDQRVYSVNPRAPLGGIEGAGWKLVYGESPTAGFESNETIQGRTDLTSSIGMVIDKEGSVLDVIPASPAERAGIPPGAKVLAINDRRFSPERLKAAVRDSRQASGPIRVLMDNGDTFESVSISYAGGARYPRLERDDRHPDLLAAILAPRSR